MEKYSFSKVENSFFKESKLKEITTHIPYLVVENFPDLGKLTALRFIEWVAENPEGTISLPTGKTPEYFIKWTKYITHNWEKKEIAELKERYGLTGIDKPLFDRLKLVQIDEFFPINSNQHNSFYYYVKLFYINGMGLDINRALLINCNEIRLNNGKSFFEIFPDHKVDLSLRYRECRSKLEEEQQRSIFLIDQWCIEYENRIRELGGIGFFLGGIGPDGHIAFNTRGSDHYSTTRLTETNFETQAVAATDLGGIEVSRNRLVITIGLQTITYNDAVAAIIIAAGEAKAKIVAESLESRPDNNYPATALYHLKSSRFYLTKGAAKLLPASVRQYYHQGAWSQEKTDRAVIDLCIKINKYGHNLNLQDLKNDPYCKLIPDLSIKNIHSVLDSVKTKIQRGLEIRSDQVFLHTGPHHDDIMLAILPHIFYQFNNAENKFYFSVFTSGFTAVTNQFMQEILIKTLELLDKKRIDMVYYADFFDQGYQYKWDKDVYHFLDQVAAGNPAGMMRGLSHRLVRALVEIYQIKTITGLKEKIRDIIRYIAKSYDGEKNPPQIQCLKGMLREFEEELVWAHFGIQTKNIDHLRLGFYKGDIFSEQPGIKRDVTPILLLLKKINPTVISLAFDPEGSGPDTHYKVMQALAQALREWKKEKDLSNLKIWGYRNVWYRFHPAEADVIYPVPLGQIAVLNHTFMHCYLSQVKASFPSHEHDGPFSELAQKIWVEQLKENQLLLGKDFFYMNRDPRIRAAHGMLYFKDMTVNEFIDNARQLEKSIEGIKIQE